VPKVTKWSLPRFHAIRDFNIGAVRSPSPIVTGRTCLTGHAYHVRGDRRASLTYARGGGRSRTLATWGSDPLLTRLRVAWLPVELRSELYLPRWPWTEDSPKIPPAVDEGVPKLVLFSALNASARNSNWVAPTSGNLSRRLDRRSSNRSQSDRCAQNCPMCRTPAPERHWHRTTARSFD
jgi:hypothetical protein